MSRGRLIVVVGPTGVGKSALALRLALALKGEIVSADSMQVYRGMDIGTGKPTRQERQQVVHHLIDVVNPDESFHAGRYLREADRAIASITGRGRVPIVVGGTGLYIKALLHGLFEDPRGVSVEGWNEKVQYYNRLGENPHLILEALDPRAARRIHPSDRVRAQRALDVLVRTGRSITYFQERHRFQDDRYDAFLMGLTMDRSMLFDRIHARVDKMVEAGFLEEVRSLMAKGYSRDLPSMRALGYRHMAMVISGETGLQEAVRLLKRDTRRYAKRQETWFRHQERARWFRHPFSLRQILEPIQEFLSGA